MRRRVPMREPPFGATTTACVECSGPVKTRREKGYRCAECGLSNVIVESVETSECQRCGETYTGIPAIEGLHRAIASGSSTRRDDPGPAHVEPERHASRPMLRKGLVGQTLGGTP